MRRLLVVFAVLAALLLAALIVAHRQTRAARSDAARFRAGGLTADALPAEWKRALLAVEDPAFYRHHGIDLVTPGAGWTTITQGLAKRYYFAHFRKGVITKVWQSLCALVLDAELSKDDQLTLLLNTAGFGPGRSAWIEGFPDAAQEFYGKPFGDLSREEFVALVAMLVAPMEYNPGRQPDASAERVRRIERLLAGQCAPRGFRDVLLDGCRAAT